MKRKRCNLCHKNRLTKFFSKRKASLDGLQRTCKDCSNCRNKHFYLNNKKYYQNRYIENKTKILTSNKKWNKANKNKTDQHKTTFRIHNPEYNKIYRILNKNRLSQQRREREQKRNKTDIVFKLKKNYRNRLYDYYKGTNRSKQSKEIIGLSWIEFKTYIESKFQQGMNWDNYGKWHIDHIIPLATARNKEELEKLFHYSNCQPLWAFDNISKGAKIFSNA